MPAIEDGRQQLGSAGSGKTGSGDEPLELESNGHVVPFLGLWCRCVFLLNPFCGVADQSHLCVELDCRLANTFRCMPLLRLLALLERVLSLALPAAVRFASLFPIFIPMTPSGIREGQVLCCVQ